MLTSLYIENIAVARRLDVPLGEGFTVITGKTGAGKSILIDSLLLLFDSRTGEALALIDADWITTMRTGAVAAISVPPLNSPIAVRKRARVV